MDNLSVLATIALGAIGVIGFVSGIAWFLIKWVFVPWLRSELTAPVADIQKHVVENHHANPKPTLPDRLDEVKAISIEAARHGKDGVHLARQAIEEIGALARMFDGHLDWSQKEVDRIWKRLNHDRKGIDK